MRKLESVNPKISNDLTAQIKDFWSRNVNAEKILGKSVTSHLRGERAYFEEIQEQRYRSHRHLKPWIETMNRGKNVLEIGCGIGIDSYTLAQRGMKVTAIDLTEVAITTARKRLEEAGLQAKFEVGDACNLDFEDETFDYVYSFGVLHHVSDTLQAINEVHRVLKKGGEALIMLYHRHSLNEIVHRITRIPFEDKHELCPVVRRYTRHEVREMFIEFSNVSIKLDFLFGEGYSVLFKLTPKWLYDFLSRKAGWHIMVRARK